MSHDDPATSLTRMGARWTAFPLIAAVLLCGRRVLADEVRVHIDSPVPATLAEYSFHSGRVGGRGYRYSETFPVCESPCDRGLTLDANRRYAITGAFPMSPTFRYSDLSDLMGRVTIRVQPGSTGPLKGGWVALLVGVGTAANPGFLFYFLGRGGSPGPGNDAWSGVGLGLMVAGGLAAITGAVLVATSVTRIKIQETEVGSVSRPAPVKPRYWMGEF